MAQLVSRPVVGDTTDIHTSALNPVGMEAEDKDGNRYIYLKGVASVVAGSWVSYNELRQAALVDTDVAASVVAPVAVAVAAVVADRWGWFARRHAGISAASATVADDAKVFATATAGTCDDTGTAGMQVHGASWRSADSAGFATVQIDNPWLGTNVA